ncbi:MAG: type VI secretion system baseplate subunit TssE [Xanthomonadales bacterium]|nr:type VI secretion system baseplate subunit TssE [Xanthomonadales bacterium]
MAELTQKERLQPSLLDRLTDEQPERQEEPRSRRVFSLSQLRKVVRRDLAWLLNAGNLETVQDLDDYPYARKSVINFGVPDLSGVSAAGLEALDMERMVKEAILNFEPRILPHTLRVNAVVDEAQMSRNAVSFTIEGQLWAQPVPIQLYLQTAVDIDTGHVDVEQR